MGLLFSIGYAKNEILEKYNHFFAAKDMSFGEMLTFSNACAIQINLNTNDFDLFKKLC